MERLNGLLFEVGATGTSGDRTLLDGASHIAHIVGIPFVSVQQVVQEAERALWGAEETSQPPNIQPPGLRSRNKRPTYQQRVPITQLLAKQQPPFH